MGQDTRQDLLCLSRKFNTRSQDWEQKAKSIPPSKLGGLLASHRAWQETPFKQTQGAIHRVEVCPSLRGQSREQWIGSAPCIWAAMSNCAPHSMSRPTGPSAMWPDHSCIKRTSRVPSPWIWADLGDRIQQVSQVTFETGPKGTLTSSLVFFFFWESRNSCNRYQILPEGRIFWSRKILEGKLPCSAKTAFLLP